MSKEDIQAQIDALPDGAQKDLAKYMNSVYEGEADKGWELYPPTYDLLKAPIWTPPEAGQQTYSDAAAITQKQHDTLARLKEQAGGWFYLKDGKLVFVTSEEWQRIRQGQQQP